MSDLHEVFAAASKADTPSEAAAIYASAGLKVFPCNPATKAPVEGFMWQRQATSSPAAVARLWDRHPDAAIGLPLGSTCGLAVVDVDVPTDEKPGKADGRETVSTWAMAGHELSETLVVATPSGGTHRFYEGALKGRAHGSVDLKGEGGYVIAPGSIDARGRKWTVAEDRPIAPAPVFLRGDLKQLGGSSWASAALRGEVERVEHSRDGERNNNLNTAAFKLGQLVASGEIAEAEAVAALTAAAARIGLEEREAAATIRSGITAGKSEPRRPAPPAATTGRAVGERRMLAAVDFDPDEELPPAEWTVDGIVPEVGLGVLYGPPGAGKSFLAADLAVGVMHGGLWFSRGVSKGSVLYVAAEGGERFKMRLRAAHRAPHVDGARRVDTLLAGMGLGLAMEPPGRIVLATETPDLVTDPDVLVARVEHEVARAPEGAPLRLVVVDTYAASTPGSDENEAGAMSAVLRPLREVATRCRLFVLIVHHPAKGPGADMRGSGVMRGDVDTVIKIELPEGSATEAKNHLTRRAVVEKQRDGEDGAEMVFDLKKVRTGKVNKFGTAETTCHIVPNLHEPAEPAGARQKAPRLSAGLREFMSVVRERARDGRARIDDVREAYIATFENRETGARNWRRQASAADERGLIEFRDTANEIVLIEKFEPRPDTDMSDTP